jgi:hypothetical protein
MTDEMRWGVFIDIIPLNDLQPHTRGKDCWCNPTVKESGDVVHKAADSEKERAWIETN